MATITPPRPRSLAEDRRRVRGPLDRLRGYIRAYVSLEGAIVSLLFLILLFWAAFALDYLLFKLTGFDWVQVLPFGVRLGVWGLLLACLLLVVTFKAVIKLFREFRDRSLALVLEKRFPKVLGQRLITAVELSDPDKAAELGYSRAMVAETIHEAAEAVDRLPLKEVFDWGRLLRISLLLVLVPLVGFVIAVVADGVLARFMEKKSFWAGLGRFPDAALTLTERDLLLRYVPWPRNAHLELIEPDTAELRVGRDAAAPTVRVRAYAFVVADRNKADGWRPLTHKDLVDRPELLKGDVPEPPADWLPRDPALGLTIDEIVLRLGRFDVRKCELARAEPAPASWMIQEPAGARPLLWSDLTSRKLGGLPVPQLSSKWDPRVWPAAAVVGAAAADGTGPLPSLANLAVGPLGLTVDEVAGQLDRDGFDSAEVRAIVHRLERLNDVHVMLDRLRDRAAHPSMSRTLRQLAIPATVSLVYRGTSTSFSKALQPSAGDEVTGNELTGTFTDLKPETYRYTVRAEDYTSATRRIVVLPPLALIRLDAEQSRPAYLYYRPAPGSDGRELRGRKQVFEPLDVSNFGSDVSRVEVPAGSDLVLVGQLAGRKDADIQLHEKDGVRVKPFKEGDLARGGELTWQGDTFRAVFADVRLEQNLVFQFKDVDGVTGSRQIVIKPKDDAPPELIDVNPDVVRKTKDGYIVSVSARVPFVGRVRDDNGLAGVRYAYTLTKIESGLKLNVQALRLFMAAPPLAAGRSGPILAGLLYATAQREGAKSPETEGGLHQVVRMGNLPGYERALRDRPPLRDGRAELLPFAEVQELLAQPQKLPYRALLNDLELKPDSWTSAENEPLVFDFPLWQLRLKEVSRNAIQPRYKLQLWVEAVDTDIDSEVERDGKTPRPHISPSKEKFTLLVVSEPELLVEIGKEEEELRIKLEEVSTIVMESEAKIIREAVDLASLGIKPQVFGAMGGRLETIDLLLDKQMQKSKEIAVDYARILKELRVNQVDGKIIDQVNKGIVTPLGELEFDFGRTHDAITSFRKVLEEGRTAGAANEVAAAAAVRSEAAKAREEIRKLKESIAGILDKMRRLRGINDLIKMLRDIDEAEAAQADLIKKIKDDLERRLLEGALEGIEPKKPKK